MIFLDRSWSPKDMAQAVGRIYRPGQTGIPEIIYINAKNSIDQRMKGLLNLKGKWFKQVFREPDDSEPGND
jgi:SNF2 family DNA or RNA helicase